MTAEETNSSRTSIGTTQSLSGKFISMTDQTPISGQRPVVTITFLPDFNSQKQQEEYIWDTERSIESIMQELTNSLFGLMPSEPKYYCLRLDETEEEVFPVRIELFFFQKKNN
jgi:hypothetical protein